MIRFGPFEVDLRADDLRKNGSSVKLQQQPFQILSALLKRRVTLSPAKNFVRNLA
jgi:DNA-binding winged helix-turn-helix (wHTH) protein